MRLNSSLRHGIAIDDPELMHRELQPPALITMLDRLGSAQAMPRLPDFKDPQEH